MSHPGQLDQRITFKAESRNDDGLGGAVRGWTDIPVTPTVWAAVRAKSGRERFDTDRVNAEAGYVFTIRNRADIDERNVIVWNSRQFNIRFVRQLSNRPLYMEIEADQGAAI
jgi:SPP1 family predicted phage head-tail adaptor